MKTLAWIAVATVMTLPLWVRSAQAQDKPAPAPPKPPAQSAPKGPAAKQGEQPAKSGDESIDKRRDRMTKRDDEIDKMMKEKGNKK